MVGSEQVLIEDWCQQYPSHSIGSLEFGPDGALYVSGGDGASFNFVDYGQDGSPLNPCGDPPGGVGATLTPPSAEGGALRSQDLRTTSDPTTLDGAILRVDPTLAKACRTTRSRPAPTPTRAGSSPTACATRSATRSARATGDLLVGDVGWNTWEEINRLADPGTARRMWRTSAGPATRATGARRLRRGQPERSARTSTPPAPAPSPRRTSPTTTAPRSSRRDVPDRQLLDRRASPSTRTAAPSPTPTTARSSSPTTRATASG